MSIDRKMVSNKFTKLILENYTGNHKELLLYLTPIIFENNLAQNCNHYINENIYKKIPERRILKADSNYGMAIGNLTSQAGSNLNLNDFDYFVVKTLKIDNYVRYVDDAIIICDNKKLLFKILPFFEEKTSRNKSNNKY